MQEIEVYTTVVDFARHLELTWSNPEGWIWSMRKHVKEIKPEPGLSIDDVEDWCRALYSISTR